MENTIRVVISSERCTRCGLCVQDCTSHALKMTEEGVVCTRPCLECGHCVAICPANAVSMPALDMADVSEYDPETFSVAPDHLLHLMKFRRSVRAFTEQPVTDAVLMQILQAGRHAPTAKNVQGLHFVALQKELPAFRQAFWDAMPNVIASCDENDPAARLCARFYEKHQKTGYDPFFMNAPAVLLVCGGSFWDAGLAAGNMELMACANGLGLLHDGFLQQALLRAPQLLEPFGLADIPVTACMLLGYAERSYARTAPRKQADLQIR